MPDDLFTDRFDDLDEILVDDCEDELLNDRFDDIDELLVDNDEVDQLLSQPFSVVERTQRCGKPDCECADNPDAEHGPYRYHVHTDPDGSRRWEYIGPAYEV